MLPLQTKKGNRPTGHDQEGRRGLNEVVPGTSVFPLSETGVLAYIIIIIQIKYMCNIFSEKLQKINKSNIIFLHPREVELSDVLW